MLKPENLSVKTIWGKVVLYLKEKRQVALHVACGDITDVELKEGKFVINVLEGTLTNLLQEGKREIENALRWQGLDLPLFVNIKEINVSPKEKDISRLKEVFDKVVIKEFKG